MKIQRLDHLVLTCNDLASTLSFYVDVLGMTKEIFDDGRLALRFGNQKINLHEAGKEIEPHAERPRPGSLDLCFVVNKEISEVSSILAKHNVNIELGPTLRTGAIGKINSLYLRDPDGNLIELSTYTNEID